MEKYERISSIKPAGVMATACRQKGPAATREAPAVIARRSTGTSRELGQAVWGDGEARSTNEAGQCRSREGASVERKRKKRRRRRDWRESINPRKCSEVADGVARQSEGSAQFSLLCAV